MKRLIIAISVCIICQYACALTSNQNPVKKETFVFSVQGSDTLRLDKYDVPDLNPPQQGKPCVLFVFGGGFATGSRDQDYNTNFMNELARRGYVAVALDYRLGMKEAKNMTFNDPMDFVRLFIHTITIAVEDLFDATRYVYDHASQWDIDKDLILACGSSAGAFTVLQGEYVICNGLEGVEKLPANFNYAGIISFAGAIFNPIGDLTWAKKPAPLMLFHGDADRNVPYDHITLGSAGIYGSKYIARQMQEAEVPYYFYDVENAAHEIAGSPMTDNVGDIESFIHRYVLKKEPLMIHSHVRQIGKEEMKKDFTVFDYIQMNYQ